jgi:hypothetical protein
MNLVVIESEAFELLKLEIKKLIKQSFKEVVEELREKESSDWLTMEEAQKHLPFQSKSNGRK